MCLPKAGPGLGLVGVIRKVYEVEPKTIDRIIRHLELTFEAERPPPSHQVQQELLMAAEERGEYFWGLSRLFFAGLRA